jgi:hypothetical protein
MQMIGPEITNKMLLKTKTEFCNISVDYSFYRNLCLGIFDLIALKGQHRLARRIAAGTFPKIETP